MYVQVESSAAAAGYIADNFFDQPSAKMKEAAVREWKDDDRDIRIKLFTSLG